MYSVMDATLVIYFVLSNIGCTEEARGFFAVCTRDIARMLYLLCYIDKTRASNGPKESCAAFLLYIVYLSTHTHMELLIYIYMWVWQLLEQSRLVSRRERELNEQQVCVFLLLFVSASLVSSAWGQQTNKQDKTQECVGIAKRGPYS